MRLLKYIPIVLLAGSLYINAQADDPALSEQDLIYMPNQMLNFRIVDYQKNLRTPFITSCGGYFSFGWRFYNQSKDLNSTLILMPHNTPHVPKPTIKRF